MAGRRGSTFIRVVVDNAGANRNLDQTEKKVRGLGPAARLAAGVVVAAFGAMAVAIAGSVGPAAEFQTGLAEIATLSEDAKSSIGAIGDSVKEVAVTFGQDLKDSTKAAYDAISAGIPTKEVGNFLKTAARAATGGLVDIATSVDVLTTSVNAWAKENLTAERASDILFSVVQRGKTTYEQLAGSLSNVANIAAAADISLEEVGAAVASLTSQGVPTSEAMTQIRGAVQGLIRDTPELISAFNQAGFASGEAAIRALGFGGAAQIVARSANGSLGAIQKMVGSVEGMNAVLGVTGSNLDLFNENLEATRRSAGVSERAFNQLANTFEFQRRRVMQGFQLLRVELGSLFLPVLTEVSKVIADFFGVAADSSDEEGEQTKSQFERIKEAVMAVSDSFGTLLGEIGKFTNVTGVFDPLVAAWEAAKDALGLSGPLFSAEDLLPADTSLAGWVEALGFEIRQALSGLTDILKSQTLRDFVAGVASILVALFSGGVSFATAGKAFGRLLLDVFRDAIPSLKTSFKNAVLVDLLNDLESITTAYLSGQVEWKTASAAFRTVISGVFKTAASEVKTALDPATTAIGGFLTAIEEKFPNATMLVKNMAGGIATLAANLKENSPTWTEFRDGFTQTLVDRVGNIATNVGTLATEADKLGGRLAEKLQPAFQWIKDNLPTIDARFAGVAIALGAFAAFVRFFNPVGAALSVVVAALATDWEKLNAQVLQFAQEQGLEEIWANIESAIVGAADQIRSFLQPVAEVGDYAGNAAVDMNSLVLAIKGFNAQQAPFDVLIGAFNRLGASISTNQEVMEIINKQILPPFREAWEELVNAFNDNKEEILTLITALVALATGAIVAVIRGIAGIIRIIGGAVNVVEGLVTFFYALASVFFDTEKAGMRFGRAVELIAGGLLQILRGLGPALLAVLSFTPIGRALGVLGARITASLQRFLIRPAVAALDEAAPLLQRLGLRLLTSIGNFIARAPERIIRLLGAQIELAGKTIQTGFAGFLSRTFTQLLKDVKKFNVVAVLLRTTFVSTLTQVPVTIASFIAGAFDTTLNSVNEGIQNALRAMVEGVTAFGVQFIGVMLYPLTILVQIVKQVFPEIPRFILASLEIMAKLALTALDLFVVGVLNVFILLGQSVVLAVRTLVDLVSEVWNFAKEHWQEILLAAVVAIVAVLTRGRVRSLSVITGMVTAVTNRFMMLRNSLIGIWTAIVSAIGSGADRIAGYVNGAIAGVRRIIQAARDAAAAVKDVPVVGGVAGAIANVLPSFQGGGIVPGRIGQPVPILAHGGEEVIPAHERGRRGEPTEIYLSLELDGRALDAKITRVQSTNRRNRGGFQHV